MREVALIAFGWLLGLLAPAIVRKIEDQSRRGEYLGSISAEVAELRFKLSALVFQLSEGHGTVDMALLKWSLAIEKAYHGDREDSHLSRFVKMIEGKPDEEIQALFLARRKAGECSGLKKYSLPLLSSNPGTLSLFSPVYQRTALELVGKLSNMNEEIDFAMFCWRKTFDSSVSPENYDVLQGNLVRSYSNISKMAKDLADKCSKLLELKN